MLSTSCAEYLILPFLQQDLGFRNSTHSLAMPKFNLKLRSSIDAEHSQLCCIWALLCALEESHRKVTGKFRFLGHWREMLSDLEEEVASHCHLQWGILVALSPRTAGIPKHSNRTEWWSYMAFLCKSQNKWVYCHWLVTGDTDSRSESCYHC